MISDVSRTRSDAFSIESISKGFLAIVDDTKDPTATLRVASFGSCYANMINSIMGAGILGLPYAFANTGWVFGVLLNLMSMYFSIIGCRLLSYCSSVVPKPSSFFQILNVVNPKLSIFVDVSVILLTFGSALAYLIIIGDLMPKSLTTLGASGFITARATWVVTGWMIAAPFACMHNLDALKWTSGLCFLFLMVTIIVIFIYAMPGDPLEACIDQDLDDDLPCRGANVWVVTDAKTFLKVFSIFIFALACQANIFAFLNEMRRPTQVRVDSLFTWAIVTAGSSYIIYGSCGYATYGDSIRSDSIINYPANKLGAVIGIFVSFIVAFSYPLQINPCRRSLLTMLQKALNKGAEPSIMQTRFRYYTITSIFLGVSLLIAMVLDDLGFVLSLVGATGSTAICFIIPGYCYLSLFSWEGCEERRKIGSMHDDLKRKLIEEEEGARVGVSANTNDNVDGQDINETLPIHEKSDFYVYAAYFQLVAGCVVCPVCLVAIFI